MNQMTIYEVTIFIQLLGNQKQILMFIDEEISSVLLNELFPFNERGFMLL